MTEMVMFTYIEYNGIESKKTGFIRDGKVGKRESTHYFKCYCNKEGTILTYENNIIICPKCKKEFKSTELKNSYEKQYISRIKKIYSNKEISFPTIQKSAIRKKVPSSINRNVSQNSEIKYNKTNKSNNDQEEQFFYKSNLSLPNVPRKHHLSFSHDKQSFKIPSESANLFTKNKSEIFSNFKKFSSKNKLCELKELNFINENIPSYEKKFIQEFYLLKYMYGYAAEYSIMFLNLLKNIEMGDVLRVLSLGCGNLVDYWALTYVLEEINKKNIKIMYDGVDLIEWNYRFKERKRDKIKIILKKNIVDFLNQEDNLSYDVFIFPKSINEIKYEDISIISNYLKDKIENKEFSILATFRDSTREEDKKKFSKIINSIPYNVEFVEEYRTPFNENRKSFYLEFKPHKCEDIYGKNICRYIKNIEKNCINYKCEKYNNFGSAPIITKRYIDYCIVKFGIDKNDS